MGVSLEIYRAAIGVFNQCFVCLCKLTILFNFNSNWLIVIFVWLCILLILAGDVEINPGPPRNFTLNMGHINARSLNYSRICWCSLGQLLPEWVRPYWISSIWIRKSGHGRYEGHQQIKTVRRVVMGRYENKAFHA
jgi:hypothetical protein